MAGVTAGLAAWLITVLSGQVAAGRLTVVVTATPLLLPYLGVAAVCGAITWYATRTPRGTA
jgi:hypothetical protein